MLMRFRTSEVPADQFHADLLSICGSFDMRTASSSAKLRGGINLEHAAGIEVAHVAADLQQLVRTKKEIRRDNSENYFLILQEEGRALMSQNDAACLLEPGDMVLIDSACPSEFTFFGSYSRQISLHLPRAEMHARFGYDLIRGGISVPRFDPTSMALCAVLGKVVKGIENATSEAYMREALFGLIGAMLHERSGTSGFSGIDSDISGAQALAQGQAYIDAHYRNHDLSIQEMADDLGISTRQLQRGFAAINSTPTRYLLTKRLEHVRRALADRQAGRRNDLISTIAYEAGFSDLSYFQRCFRKAFGASPRAAVSGLLGGPDDSFDSDGA
ncbi:helix-turn-helix domain-containing protein [Rhodobacter sp. SY28-1]|uniref:helix-turn-helix domain-containing protein n=1 Tax=Rhodobacter sp. SY28-1 TaxID=2562317 RepID=UPI0010BFCAE7|nr:helix-turn-helix domain-containing protein [Rhodobacter sp. SY28-1]